MDTARRRVLWPREVGKPLSPQCGQGNSSGNSLLALSLESGELLWEGRFPHQATAFPIASGRAILCSFGNTFYKLAPVK